MNNINDVASRIESLDFSSLKQKLMKEHGWTSDYADCAEESYKAFLYAHVQCPGVPLSASAGAEMMWNAHLDDTARYLRDCEEIFGKQKALRAACPDYLAA